MGTEEVSNAYEELRRKNIERNEEVMRALGLISSSRVTKVEEAKELRSHDSARSLKKWNRQPRRSARIARLNQPTLQSTELEVSSIAVASRISSSTTREVGNQVQKTEVEAAVHSDVMEKENDDYNREGEDYSTDDSSDSFYAEHFDMGGQNMRTGKAVANGMQTEKQAVDSTVVNLDSMKLPTTSGVGSQLEEMLMRFLMQSTGTLFGPPPSPQLAPEDESTGLPIQGNEVVFPTSLWDAATYNKAEASRRRKPSMLRTSAGEGSDSQVDYAVPANESPQQRSLRTRRLNRSRARRAKDLSSNRRAVNKLPYVIHVDGAGKAKGIHRHKWRAAVRGQCGRLDPTMDNINHHPKHVVDSMWHALEKEWEFEGYAHRSREMFERSATKFMRNRKMQLKYKCLKRKDAPKPDDVSPQHWAKIVDLTRKSTKDSMFSGSIQTNAKGKEVRAGHHQQERKPLLLLPGSEDNRKRGALDIGSKSDVLLWEGDDIDTRIESLKTELLRLQNSKEVRFRWLQECALGGSSSGAVPVESALNTIVDEMKENVKPSKGKAHVVEEASSKMLGKKTYGGSAGEEKRSTALLEGIQEVEEKESSTDGKETEMDSGDVVRMLAFVGGMNKEIGKGIVMGLAGSKFARKVIPNSWRSIKVTSYTCIGAAEVCPYPAGWSQVVKPQTLKEANGRTILWPDSLLRSLLQK